MRRLAVVLLLVALASGASPPVTLSARPSPVALQDTRIAEIQALLDERARAILEGDRDAFAATLDQRNQAFARRQMLLFDGYQQLPLRSYRLDLSFRFFDELTTAREVARYGEGAQPGVFHVEERYRLHGYDRQPALEELVLTFVRRPSGWLLAADDDMDDLTLFSGRKLWEFGPIVTRRSEHFLYVSHPDQAGSAETVLRAAEQALARVERMWPLPWPGRVVILVPSSTDELRRILQSTFDLDVFVAFAVSGVDRADDWELVGHRIILHWDNFSRYPEATRQSILTHELLHIATREYTGPHTRAFVDEGLAEWVTPDPGTALLAGRVRTGSFDRRLPLDHEFITGSDVDIVNSYQESYSWARYVADRVGGEGLAELYRRLGSVRKAPGTWRYHLDQALRGTFGVGFEALEARWADWAVATYG